MEIPTKVVYPYYNPKTHEISYYKNKEDYKKTELTYLKLPTWLKKLIKTELERARGVKQW